MNSVPPNHDAQKRPPLLVVRLLHTKNSLLILILGIVLISNLADFAADWSQGAETSHLLQEALLALLSAGAIIWLSLGIRHQQQETARLRQDMAAASAEAARRLDGAVATARHQLGQAIQQQFQDWGLTRSEQEVALLLLKGLSFKEIAGLRDTAEKTVRQQASGIYRKAGISGRHAFSAWFIEDFL